MISEEERKKSDEENNKLRRIVHSQRVLMTTSAKTLIDSGKEACAKRTVVDETLKVIGGDSFDVETHRDDLDAAMMAFTDAAAKGSNDEEGKVNVPMVAGLNALLGTKTTSVAMSRSRNAPRFDSLIYGARAHNIDTIILAAERLICWPALKMAIEGKRKLVKKNDLSGKHEAIGQCLQRLHAQLCCTPSARRILWAAFHDDEFMGFVKVTRSFVDGVAVDPHEILQSNDAVTIFNEVPLRHGLALIKHLLGNDQKLGFYEETFDVEGLDGMYSLGLLESTPKEMKTAVVAVAENRQSSDTLCSDRANYVVKASLRNGHDNSVARERQILQRLSDVQNVIELLDQSAALVQAQHRFPGLLLKPIGTRISMCGDDEPRLGRYATYVSNLRATLTVIHGRRIIHRDITPNNIIEVVTTEGGSCYLIDFGESSIDGQVSDSSKHALTRHWASKRRRDAADSISPPHPDPRDDFESLFLTFAYVSAKPHFRENAAVLSDEPATDDSVDSSSAATAPPWEKMQKFDQSTVAESLRRLRDRSDAGRDMANELRGVATEHLQLPINL